MGRNRVTSSSEHEGVILRPTRLLAVFACVLTFVATAAGSASATTVEECQAELTTLRADTVAAEASFANAKDFNGLIAKLDTASAKLVTGKNADAVEKLIDFQTRLDALATAPKPKLDPDVAQALSLEADEVVACINAIGAA